MRRDALTFSCVFLLAITAGAQSVPQSTSVPVRLNTPAVVSSSAEPALDPRKTYGLAELIDFAEARNPATRVAWEQAKVRAAEIGIARAALFPTIAVAAVEQQTRDRVLFGNAFYRQDINSVLPIVSVYYAVIDFGRSAGIEGAQAGLLAADFAFNNTHRQVIYAVTSAYYRLDSALAQQQAADATLMNAQTVQQAVEARLKNGLATLPDVLEARAATAQASYELETVRGLQRLAHGQLAEALGVRPTVAISVQPIGVTSLALGESADAFIGRALAKRPDLLAQAAQIQAAAAAVRSARSKYFPDVVFSGSGGDQYQNGYQPPGPAVSSTGVTWMAKLSANWTLFDGRARYNDLDRARSAQRQSEAEYAEMQDRIADEVWAAYSNVQTSLERQGAARALLAASQQSYDAVLEAYRYGVKNFLDVVAAQRTLAQARTDDVQSQAEVFINFAQLAFASGDLAPLPNGAVHNP